VEVGRIRPSHWLGLVLCVPFNVLTLMAGWQKGHLAHKKPCSSDPQMSEQVEKNMRGNWLIPGFM